MEVALWCVVAALVAFTVSVVAYAWACGVRADAKKRVDAVEQAYMQTALSASRAVLEERRLTEAYLREQARMAESVSKYGLLGARGSDQEAYAAAVLEETADEISERRHHRVQS